MSDRYYGIFQNDDALYSAYNAALPSLASANLQNPKQQMPQVLNANGNAEISNYFGTSANAVGTPNTFDINNNRVMSHSMRYFNGNAGVGHTIGGSNHQQPQQQLYNNGMLSQFAALGDNPYLSSSAVVAPQMGTGGYGSVASLSYSYNRNRYMPYTRNGAGAASALISPFTPNNSMSLQSVMLPSASSATASTTVAAAAATVGTASVGSISTTAKSYSSYHQFAAIYQSYPNTLSANGGGSNGCATFNNAALPGSTSGTDPTCNSSDASTKRTMASDVNNRIGPQSFSGGGLGNTYMKRNIAAPEMHCLSAVEGNTNAAQLAYDSTSKSTGSKLDPNQLVTLQITNLDYSMEEANLRNFLLSQLKPITPVLSLVFEGSSYAKVTVPDLSFAKQVVSNLHRKKIGHKRMLVSYTRDSSQTEINTLRCQVAGLLKDVPYYTLPMYKFRELFQSRFKTSISVLDLYKMPDICTITVDNSEEKFISLQASVISSLEHSPLMEGLQHSVPYCTVHFKREQHKGWAEQDIEPLPNVWMTIAEIQNLIYPLLKNHPGDIPVASLVHCISSQLNYEIKPNDQGVNLEHLVCCVQGVQIQMNNFGIKILGWLESDKENSGAFCGGSSACSVNVTPTSSAALDRGLYGKTSNSDPLYQISREVIELIKMSPKSTMKFNRFIPAYHNHFGKQCRVADYGYTKLIELFEALSSVVQIIGDGENRQITLTHRTQLRRFTSDLLRVLRAHGNKSVVLSHLPVIFSQTQNRNFDVTDYGVCDIRDILDGLANSNVVVMSRVPHSDDMLISIPKRKQTNVEVEKTILFAGEMVELFRNAPQYTILFQKFVRSYHYHFAYQCRLSDYGFLKLADLMEAIQGVVEMEQTCDEDKKIYLSPKVARRVFAEQCEELIRNVTGEAQYCMKLDDVLQLHKKKYGYQIQPQTLGVVSISEAVGQLPYVEVFQKEDNETWIVCHRDDVKFRSQCYRAVNILLIHESEQSDSINETGNDENNISSKKANGDSSGGNISINEKQSNRYFTIEKLIIQFNKMYPEDKVNESNIKAMKHAIEVFTEDNKEYFVRNSNLMKFILNIICLLEQRKNMSLFELKNILHCNISTTFEFGYPNLLTILLAHSDIFCVNTILTQEHPDISLQPNCELHVGSYMNHQSISAQPKLSLNKSKSMRRNLPLSEHNSRSFTSFAPPPKTRAIAINESSTSHPLSIPTNTYKNKVTSATYQSSMKLPRTSSFQKPTAQCQPQLPHTNHQVPTQSQSLPLTMPLQAQIQIQQSQQLKFANFESKNLVPTSLVPHNSFNVSNNSIYSVASHNSSLNTSASNTTQCHDISFNTSTQNLSAGNSSSNLSFSDLNMNVSSSKDLASTTLHATTVRDADMNSNSKLWDRRRAACYQEPSSMPADAATSGFTPLQLPSVGYNEHAARMTPFNINQQQQQFMPLQQMFSDAAGLQDPTSAFNVYPTFVPPKPDTPPSNQQMPFWIDPIWSHNSEQTHVESALLNIKLPELKSLNVLPMVMSPYTLSKAENMKRKVFNFDNHDRKIA